ncbi:hypothetical protein BH753_gp138 [Bacillus phage Shbh1]|uniref:Uncharacterized protein n=1 Tax=Bacillus phage Shbh1 TaxID=1796992 RepID=A0A142F1G3_9CAUD|nr:hypothetical protein BH753_gp138 [Bacillus phage Shbh1]AMQ66620.1 hypothetical protein [Bacillus phage Shbh1]
MSNFKWRSKQEVKEEKSKTRKIKEEMEQFESELKEVPDLVRLIGQSLTDREIADLEKGQQLTDIELRLLMLEVK